MICVLGRRFPEHEISIYLIEKGCPGVREVTISKTAYVVEFKNYSTDRVTLMLSLVAFE